MNFGGFEKLSTGTRIVKNCPQTSLSAQHLHGFGCGGDHCVTRATHDIPELVRAWICGGFTLTRLGGGAHLPKNCPQNHEIAKNCPQVAISPEMPGIQQLGRPRRCFPLVWNL